MNTRRYTDPAPFTPDEVTEHLESLQSGERDIRALNATIKALRAQLAEAVDALNMYTHAIKPTREGKRDGGTFGNLSRVDDYGQDTLSRISGGAR